MALSYAIEGKGVIANADSTSADTGHPNYPTTSGSWAANGSGGASITLTTDTFYYGSASISTAVSGAGKHNWITYDIQSGHELDFTPTTGTETDQFVYIWVHCPTIGLSDTLANEGVAIRIGSGTGAYRSFIVAGSNGSNGWDGGWQCFVIDPTKTGSISDTGSPNMASVRYIGARIITTASAKGDNLFVSQIAVGSGIRITGTSTTAWSDAVTYCTDLTNRAWGPLQEREGIYYAYGNVIIGDTAMSANCDFDDEGRVVQFGISEYWSGTGTTFQTALPTTASGITLEDDNTPTSYTTTFTDGVVVGSDKGRSGSTILGNANESVFLDFSGLANTGSDVNLYGTTFKDITGAITLEGDTDHVYYSCNFVGCSQVDPVGAPVIRNCIFAETSDTDAALLWNESIDIEDCSFIANTTGCGIEHPVITSNSYTYTNLVFSGNSPYDVLNTPAASTVNAGSFTTGRGYKIKVAGDTVWTDIGAADNNVGTKFIATGAGSGTGTATDLLVINKGGTSDPTTSEDAGSEADEYFLSSIEITINVQDADTDPIQSAQVGIYTIADRTEIMNEATTAGGVAYEAYSGTTPGDVEIRVRKNSVGGTRYKPFSTLGNISGDYTLLVTLEEDPVV